MKKTLSLAIAVILVFACMFTLAACGKKNEFVGVYEMQEISGTLTSNGTTTQLDKSLYKYYTIELKADNTAIVRSEATGTTNQAIEAEATWKAEGNVIKLISTVGGISITEEMTYDNGTLTYSSKQSAAGMTIEMTMTLVKQ